MRDLDMADVWADAASDPTLPEGPLETERYYGYELQLHTPGGRIEVWHSSEVVHYAVTFQAARDWVDAVRASVR